MEIGKAITASALLSIAVLGPSIRGAQPPVPKERNTLLGFTAFPYDLTTEAISKTHDIILPNSDLYAIHLDQCLPWAEALRDASFPEWLERDWDDVAAHIPA